MNEDKNHKDVADHIEKGLQSLCKGNVTLKDRVQARDLYDDLLIGRKPKEAVSYLLWEMAKHDVQNWAAAMSAAYAKKGPKTKQ